MTSNIKIENCNDRDLYEDNDDYKYNNVIVEATGEGCEDLFFEFVKFFNENKKNEEFFGEWDGTHAEFVACGWSYSTELGDDEDIYGDYFAMSRNTMYKKDFVKIMRKMLKAFKKSIK